MEGADDAFVLLCYTVHTADPLAAIAQRPDALDEMWAPEGQDEKVPWREKSPYRRVSERVTHHPRQEKQVLL